MKNKHIYLKNLIAYSLYTGLFITGCVKKQATIIPNKNTKNTHNKMHNIR